MSDNLKKLAFDGIDKRRECLNNLSQSIWKTPELCFEEIHGHDVLTKFFEDEGFTVERNHPLQTSFIATFGKGDGLTIGLICEYDALPEIGHACGHNLIAEAGAAAAVGVKDVLAQLPNCPHKVVVYGTPAEEGGGGKVLMMEKGIFKNADICMMVHPFIRNEYSPLALAIQPRKYTFHGKASHAAAAPWEGINALDALVACYNSVSMLRQQLKPTTKLHCIVTNGGAKPNIIPELTQLSYFIRDATVEELDIVIEKVDRCANAASIATGCTVEIEKAHAYECYQNILTNATIAKLFCASANLVGEEYEERGGLSGSTDMGNVSQIVPSIHPHYAIPTDGVNHTRAFTIASGAASAQEPTLNAAKAMAGAAVEIICNPNLMDDIKNDFKNKICKF